MPSGATATYVWAENFWSSPNARSAAFCPAPSPSKVKMTSPLVVVGPMADSIADEIRLAMPSFVASAPVAAAPVDKPVAVNVQEAEKWLKALGGRENVRQLDAVAMTRLRVELGDDSVLSEADLTALGCQGVSQLDSGVWHLLIGDKASGLTGRWIGVELIQLTHLTFDMAARTVQ